MHGTSIRILSRSIVAFLVLLSAAVVATPTLASEEAAVSGRVTSVDGDPIPDITVTAWDQSTNRGQVTTTAADGSYRIEGLAPGGHRIQANEGDVYWSPDATYFGQDRLVELAPGANAEDFELDYRYGLVFHVVNGDGEPLRNVVARVQLQDEETGEWRMLAHDPPTTRESGSVLLGFSQTFRVCFADVAPVRPTPEYRYQTACWEDADDFEDATPVTVDPADRKQDVTIVLQPEERALHPQQPTLNGLFVVGRPIEADPGEWGPAPVELSYQWFRGAIPIEGATSARYVATVADHGRRLSVEVTGSKDGYESVSVRSAPSGLVSTLPSGPGLRPPRT